MKLIGLKTIVSLLFFAVSAARDAFLFFPLKHLPATQACASIDVCIYSCAYGPFVLFARVGPVAGCPGIACLKVLGAQLWLCC